MGSKLFWPKLVIAAAIVATTATTTAPAAITTMFLWRRRRKRVGNGRLRRRSRARYDHAIQPDVNNWARAKNNLVHIHTVEGDAFHAVNIRLFQELGGNRSGLLRANPHRRCCCYRCVRLRGGIGGRNVRRTGGCGHIVGFGRIECRNNAGQDCNNESSQCRRNE